MMRSLGKATVLGLVLGLVVSAAPVSAHDHRRPKVILRSHGESQTGRPWTWTWSRATGGGCSIVHTDGESNYRRRAMAWNPNNPLHLYLYKRQEPERVKVRTYRRLGDDGFPVGNGRRAQLHLRRKVLDNGRRIWIADFNAPDRRRLYLDARAVWRDVEGCGGAQSLDMVFHIRRK